MPRSLTRFELALLLLAGLAFLLLAGYRIDAPGLYADEALFVPAALKALGWCDIPGAYVSHRWGRCFPVFLNPPYLGALKAWLYTPVLALFEPSTAALRWPAIVISLGALALLFALLRRALGTGFAVAATVLAALDPVLVFHSRFDWAPFVVSNACKLALLAALWRWLRDGGTGRLAWVFAFSVLGLYDKLNFLWIILAFAGAALASHPAIVLRHLRAAYRPQLALTAVFCLILLLAFRYRVIPAMMLDIPHLTPELGLALQWQKLWTGYAMTFGAVFAHHWILARGATPPSYLPTWLLAAQAVAFALLAARRPWRREPERWRLLVFLSVAIALMLLQMLLTPQLGSAQHLALLWPLPTLHLLLLVEVWVSTLRGRESPRPAGALATPAACVALLLIAASVPRHLDLLAGWRGEFGFHGRFDPAMSGFAKELAATPAERVVATDWGLALPLIALTPPQQASRIEEWWPSLMRPADEDPAGADSLYRDRLAGRDTVFLSFVPGQEVFPETRKNAPSYFARWGGCLVLERTLPSVAGAPLYQIWRYRTDRNCAVPELGGSGDGPMF